MTSNQTSDAGSSAAATHAQRPNPFSSAESSSAPRPDPFSDPDPDTIEHVQPSSSISTSSGASKPEVHRTVQQPGVPGSSSGSSEDDITPVGGQHASHRKNQGGKGGKFGDRYDVSEYHIEQLSVYDDIDMVKPWHRKLILIHPFVIILVFATYSAYYGYRVWCNYQYRIRVGGLAEASWIFICVEGIIIRQYSSKVNLIPSLQFNQCPICPGWAF